MKNLAPTNTESTKSPLELCEETAYYIGGLPTSTTESDLYTHFESCGEISSIKLLKSSSGNSKKSGILKIKPNSPDSVLAMDKSALNSKKIRVRLCTGKKSSKVSKNEARVLFVGNIPCLSNEDSIGLVFEQYGEIKEIRIMKTPDGKVKGSCYVEYISTESAHKALEMNNKILDGKVLKVDLAEEKFAEKKNYIRPYFWALEI